MIKKTALVLLLPFALGLISKADADVLLDYTFEGSVLTPAAQLGLTGSNFSYVGTATPFFTTTTALDPTTRGFGGAAYGANTWATGSANTLSNYFAFSLTADSLLTFTSLTFDERRSGTGPIGGTQDITVQMSIVSDTTDFLTIGTVDLVFDNTGYNDSPTGTAPFPASFSFSGLIPTLEIGQSVYFRIYASNAEAGTGTFSVDNVVVNGTAAVPEPGTVALVSLGLGVALFGVRRRLA